MKKVKEEITPKEYLTTRILSQIDFSDTFSTINRENSLEEITKLVFNSPPKWITQLFVLRNRMAKWVGLRTAPLENSEKDLSFFKTYSVSDTEIILGANDSHLNFRAVIANKAESTYNIKVITLVQYNNTKGKVYMGIIKPFHKMVVKRMVKNAFRMASASG